MKEIHYVDLRAQGILFFVLYLFHVRYQSYNISSQLLFTNLNIHFLLQSNIHPCKQHPVNGVHGRLHADFLEDLRMVVLA